MNQKGFMRIIIFLVVATAAVFGGGVWYYNESRIASLEAVTWKKYSYDKYGFELEYPSRWGEPKPISVQLNPGYLVHDFLFGFEVWKYANFETQKHYTLKISLLENQKNETLSEWKAKVVKQMREGGAAEIINIKGKEILQFTNVFDSDLVALGYMILAPDQKTVLYLHFEKGVPSVEIADHIISSVNFLE